MHDDEEEMGTYHYVNEDGNDYEECSSDGHGLGGVIFAIVLVLCAITYVVILAN